MQRRCVESSTQTRSPGRRVDFLAFAANPRFVTFFGTKTRNHLFLAARSNITTPVISRLYLSRLMDLSPIFALASLGWQISGVKEERSLAEADRNQRDITALHEQPFIWRHGLKPSRRSSAAESKISKYVEPSGLHLLPTLSLIQCSVSFRAHIYSSMKHCLSCVA